jgi:hemerythrin-like domain-containing protein
MGARREATADARKRRPAVSELDMLVTPEDVIDVLLDCHEGIRQHVALARTLASADARADDSLARTALRVRRYFEWVVPLHARDEEDSLVPRLRGADPALDRELNARQREHRASSRATAALVAACEEVVRVPSRFARVAPYLARVATELERDFADHLAHEEEVLFAAVRRHLDATASAEVMLEIHRRWLGPGVELRSRWIPRCA